jgi:hypothetical protein
MKMSKVITKESARPRRNRKPKLRAIDGALSIYRIGDTVTFEINEREFVSPISNVHFDEAGNLWLDVAIAIAPGKVRRVERADHQIEQSEVRANG